MRWCQVVKAEAGKLKAPDGLEYELNPQWVNPTGEWRVGLKRAFDLFTAPLIARLRRERRKRWDAAHRRCVTAALAAVREFEASLGTPPRTLTDADTRYKADLEARIKLLEVPALPTVHSLSLSNPRLVRDVTTRGLGWPPPAPSSTRRGG